jgi:hypothetical protein
MTYDYKYTWGNNAKREQLKGKLCRILARGKKDSVLIELEDGQKEIVSRRSLRRINEIRH